MQRQRQEILTTNANDKSVINSAKSPESTKTGSTHNHTQNNQQTLRNSMDIYSWTH